MMPAISIMLLLLFIGYAIIGPNGILAWGSYSRQLQERQNELKLLKTQEAALANRVNLLDPRHADPDMVRELVREKLGLVHPDEVILPMH